jgi:hypothetical protein
MNSAGGRGRDAVRVPDAQRLIPSDVLANRAANFNQISDFFIVANRDAPRSPCPACPTRLNGAVDSCSSITAVALRDSWFLNQWPASMMISAGWPKIVAEIGRSTC